MPYCPKCLNKLSKRKSDNTYNCSKHGFVRKVMSPPTAKYYLDRKEQETIDEALRESVEIINE